MTTDEEHRVPLLDADPTIEELRAEVARLRSVIETHLLECPSTSEAVPILSGEAWARNLESDNEEAWSEVRQLRASARLAIAGLTAALP